jgi:Na+-translocating ferredoxin:NAD+ oxidoreductase RnfE subunit
MYNFTRVLVFCRIKCVTVIAGVQERSLEATLVLTLSYVAVSTADKLVNKAIRLLIMINFSTFGGLASSAS